MNREIKFRVWDNVEKIYLHNKGFQDVTFRYNGLCFPYGTRHSIEAYPDRFVVEQFTELKDKNEKEIYEGDIIKWSHLMDDFGYIEYYSGEPFAETRLYPSCALWVIVIAHKGLFPFQSDDEYEVIGNIHENPELLK